MDVVLLYPEVYDMARFKENRKEFPPFGVLYLASAIRNAGHHVEIRKVNKDGPAYDLRGYDAIGFSLSSSATYGIMLDARQRAQIDQGALIMVGGVHANFYPGDSLNDFDADIVSFADADETIALILDHSRDRMFGSIPGIMWKENGKIRKTSPVPPSKDISHLPLPARDLLDVEDFVMTDRLGDYTVPMAHVMFSRGCPFPCAFCAAGRTRIQYRNGESARYELEHLVAEYDIGGFAIVDDNFIVNKQRVREICASIADLGMHWTALSRVDTIDPELLKVMAASGCIEVKYGVESGSERILRAMKKHTTREQITNAVQWSVEVGIEPKAFVIHGYPGENLASTRETIDLLDRLSDRIARVSLFRFVPLPGTYAYENPLEFGIRGTHKSPDWDGNWEKFHILHNYRHWWGSNADFDELQASYLEIEEFIEKRWGRQTA
jgi:anaerobic magnesium-protoporphyrin IX monomethyl ester cyclase